MVRMKKICMLCMLCLPFIAACNNDDDEPVSPETTTTTVEPLEVTLVFEPGQLGDRSMNDQLLTDLYAFGAANKDSVATSFISYSSFAETQQALRLWAESAHGRPQRNERLLVLAAPSLAPLLANINLKETDRLLLLRTPLSDAKAVGPAGRTHVMNVSLKSVIQTFIDREMTYYATLHDDYDPDEIYEGPFRIIRNNATVTYADSIVEAFQERFPDQPLSDDPDEGIWQSGITDGTKDNAGYAQELAYSLAVLFDEAESDDFDDELHQHIGVVDLGMGNVGFEYYYFTHSESSTRTLLVGNVLNVDSRLDYAIVHIPLKEWLQGWLTHPEEQPEEQWHGAWDRCTQFSPASDRSTSYNAKIEGRNAK